MRQRLKGFVLLISVIFLIAYITSEYYAKKVDTEVDIYNKRINILYNAHEVLYHITAIQKGNYSFLYGTFDEANIDLMKSNFTELDQSISELSRGVSYIFYAGMDDSSFRVYSHHVEVIDNLNHKFTEKVKTAIETKDQNDRKKYLKEAIEIGEGVEVFVRELDKFVDEEYRKIKESLPTVTEKMRRIRNITGLIFFSTILLSSVLFFSSCTPMINMRLFSKAMKERKHACDVEMDNAECTREVASAFNTVFANMKKGEESSESLTITDPLTEVYNRRYFDIRVDEEMNRCIRYGTIFSVSIIDIDHFKAINDTYGHQAGDLVLKEVVALIRDNSRETDMVARYGGEEFVIIYPCTPKRGVLTHIERFREVVESHRFKDIDRRITISIGAADSAAKNNVYQVIQEADSNLYMAKNKGRNRCVIAGVTA